MMIFWLIVLTVVVVAVGIVVGAGVRERRVDKKIADTANWQQTEATIHDGVVERLNEYTWYPNLAFSYSVDGEYFSGRFFLKADREQSDELIRTLINQKFPVQYDPQNPSEWYIAEATIGGFEIIQRLSSGYPPDTGPYRSDVDQPIDLHLGG